MKCIIIGKIVSCLLAGQSPVQSGVEAARILQKSVPPYVYVPPVAKGPTVTFLYGDPSGGPYGSFEPYPYQRPLTCCSLYIHPFQFGVRGIGFGPRPGR